MCVPEVEGQEASEVQLQSMDQAHIVPYRELSPSEPLLVRPYRVVDFTLDFHIVARVPSEPSENDDWSIGGVQPPMTSRPSSPAFIHSMED